MKTLQEGKIFPKLLPRLKLSRATRLGDDDLKEFKKYLYLTSSTPYEKADRSRNNTQLTKTHKTIYSSNIVQSTSMKQTKIALVFVFPDPVHLSIKEPTHIFLTK